MKFEDLPPRIQKKIDTTSAPGCWVWTGAASPARQRVRAYHASNTDGPNQRNFSHFNVREKAVPMCHDPALGYAVPAHRRIFALSVGTSTPLVPRLGRCAHDLCVNPIHCLPVEDDEKAAERKIGRLRRADMALRPEITSQEDILTRLKVVRPAPYLSPESAAEEANCPVPNPETWAAYVAWDAVEPDEVE